MLVGLIPDSKSWRRNPSMRMNCCARLGWPQALIQLMKQWPLAFGQKSIKFHPHTIHTMRTENSMLHRWAHVQHSVNKFVGCSVKLQNVSFSCFIFIVSFTCYCICWLLFCIINLRGPFKLVIVRAYLMGHLPRKMTREEQIQIRWSAWTPKGVIDSFWICDNFLMIFHNFVMQCDKLC